MLRALALSWERRVARWPFEALHSSVRGVHDQSSVPPAPSVNPYAAEQKIQVNPRIYRSLWRSYEHLVEGVRDNGGRASLTDLVNAVLHFHLPDDPAHAQRLLNRYRTMLAVDPDD